MKQTILKAMSVVAVLVTVTLAQGIPATGLVAWYNFSGNYNDSSGFGNHLVNAYYPPTTYADRFGAQNSSCYFNGTTNSLFSTKPDSALPSGNSPRTISVWVWPQTVRVVLAILFWGDTVSGHRCGLTVNWENSNQVVHFGNGISEITAITSVGGLSPSVQAQGWTHIAVTMSTSTVKIYVDNILVTSSPATNWNTPIDTFFIGGYPLGIRAATTYNWFGALDDICIYNRELSAAEIQKLYSAKSYRNNPSRITSTPITEGYVGKLYSYTMVSSDADAGTTLQISLSTKPTGMTLTNNIVSWTPTQNQLGQNPVVLTVTDGIDTVHQEYTINVLPPVHVIHSLPVVSQKVLTQPTLYNALGKRCIGITAGAYISNKIRVVR